ncbi:MAG: InlB B-repeat-containing protein, partial [Acidimicrobiales bacterium]
GATFTPTASSTLYAQWTANTYTVAFDAGGGTVATSSATYTTGSAPLTLPNPAQQGFSFDGWYSAPTGGSLIGLAGATFTPTASSTLYAQWTALPVWQMSFGDNGAAGTVPTLSAQQDTLITVPSGSGLTRPGYSFVGWNTAIDGSGTSYDAGQSVALTAPVELFAQWRALPAVSLEFSLGTSSAQLAPVSTYVGAGIILPVPPARSRPGYLFAGWSTSASGAGARWRSGSQFKVTSTMTLYAQWRTNHAAVMLPPVGPFARSSARVPVGLASQVTRIAVTVVSSAHRTVILYGLARRRTTAAAAARLAQARALAVSQILRADLRRLGDGSVRLVVARQVVSGARSDVVEVVAR